MNLFCNKNFAFTLAEVLITLGIIGVVAAITLPTVVQNYQKQATVAKLKKAYTTINQAVLLSIAENGDYADWDKPTEIGDEKYFEKYWLPYLKGATICSNKNRCGYGRSGVASSTFTQMNGTLGGNGVINTLNISAIYGGRVSTLLPDGSFVIFFNSFDNRIQVSWILIDINGGEKPNTYGKDVFLFDRNAKGAIVPRCQNLSATVINRDCSKNGSGECCAQKIISEGWKMNY